MAGLWIVDDMRTRAGARHAIRLTDVELDVLEADGALPDRYAGCSWSTDSLEALVTALEGHHSRLRLEIEVGILRALRRETVEEWMSPMLEERLASSQQRRAVERVLEMARLAQSERAVLIFEGD